MFDRPLFTVGRDSNLRRLCQMIVLAKYEARRIDTVTGLPVQLEYKQIHSLLGLLTYLDWLITGVCFVSCGSLGSVG